MRKCLLGLYLLTNFFLNSIEMEHLWEIALPGKVLTTPIERENGEIILICDDRRVYSLNSFNGKIIWKVKPGGRLDFLELSPDGSIIVRDEKNIYSYYSNGELRWSLNFPNGFQSNLSINERGDILFSSDNNLIIIDRFSHKNIIAENFQSNLIFSLKNSLIAYIDGKNIIAITYSGVIAWQKEIFFTPRIIKSFNEEIYIINNEGDVEVYSLIGELKNSLNTNNKNIKSVTLNYNNDIILKGDSGTTLIKDQICTNNNEIDDLGLYYSNGLLIQSKPDWTIHGSNINRNFEYYPSGQIQLFKRDISLSHKTVWGDEYLKEYYKNIVLDGNREIQKGILEKIEFLIDSNELLDHFPNFYDFLLLASSKQNRNQDIRQESYRLIGLSQDISFLPYLLWDLEGEKSYMVMPYIFYALGQIGVDRSGKVISMINSKVDDYYDEKLVINALYALYNINNYTNGEFTYSVFSGIEKILNGGYSRNIQNQCYDIIKLIK